MDQAKQKFSTQDGHLPSGNEPSPHSDTVRSEKSPEHPQNSRRKRRRGDDLTIDSNDSIWSVSSRQHRGISQPQIQTDSPPTPLSVLVTDQTSQGHVPEDDATDSSEDNTLYCICRQPYDDSRWMIGCDGGCDDWFHGPCVGMQQSKGDLVERFVCPNCEASGRGKTTWKRVRHGKHSEETDTPEDVHRTRDEQENEFRDIQETNPDDDDGANSDSNHEGNLDGNQQPDQEKIHTNNSLHVQENEDGEEQDPGFMPGEENNFKFLYGSKATGRSAKQLNALFNSRRMPLNEPSEYFVQLSYRRLGDLPPPGLADRLVAEMERKEAEYQAQLHREQGWSSDSDSDQEDERIQPDKKRQKCS